MTYGVRLERRPPVRLDPHPDAPETEAWRAWALEQEQPRAIDLFSGGGGLSLGLEDAGYKVVLAIDSNERSLETHRHNFAGAALNLDLSTEQGVAKLLQRLKGIPIDLVAGGPPCQPFSRAGRSKIRSLVQKGQRDCVDERRELWRAFLRVVEEVSPRAVLFENVPDMALGDDLTTVREIVSRLESAGYEVYADLVDAWRHGVPQHRQRLIIVALRDAGIFVWPPVTSSLSVRDAIFDLPRLRGRTGKREMRYTGPKSSFQRRARRGMENGRGDVVWDHVTRPVRDDDREAFNLMRPDTRYSELPARLRRYRSDIFDDKYKRLGWNERSRSITAHIAKDGYWYIHPSEARTLTVREAARIQTFPDHFRFAGTRSDAFRQIGNAVPPALAESIVSAMDVALSRSPVSTHERPSARYARVRQMLLAWAAEDSDRRPWRYPGDPWAVLVGTILERRLGTSVRRAQSFLDAIPDPSRATRRAVEHWAKPHGGRALEMASRLVPIARLVRSGLEAWFETNWPDAGDLTRAESDVVQLVGLLEDGLLLNAATLRVAGRLNGVPDDELRGRSAARMWLGRVVGTGDAVPTLNAALAVLGATLCSPSSPACSVCPLAQECPRPANSK